MGWMARKHFHDAMCAVLTGSGENWGWLWGGFTARGIVNSVQGYCLPERVSVQMLRSCRRQWGLRETPGNRFLQIKALHLSGEMSLARRRLR